MPRAAPDGVETYESAGGAGVLDRRREGRILTGSISGGRRFSGYRHAVPSDVSRQLVLPPSWPGALAQQGEHLVREAGDEIVQALRRRIPGW